MPSSKSVDPVRDLANELSSIMQAHGLAPGGRLVSAMLLHAAAQAMYLRQPPMQEGAFAALAAQMWDLAARSNVLAVVDDDSGEGAS